MLDEAYPHYTGDSQALESDEIFVKFVTGWDDAFVVEDADHLVQSRADGNEHLHRFLAIADGVCADAEQAAAALAALLSVDRKHYSLAEVYRAALGKMPSSHPQLRSARVVA